MMHYDVIQKSFYHMQGVVIVEYQDGEVSTKWVYFQQDYPI